jgi:dipeptidyl aminopeptidase/acylaminoacyl peptidase
MPSTALTRPLHPRALLAVGQVLVLVACLVRVATSGPGVCGAAAFAGTHMYGVDRLTNLVLMTRDLRVSRVLTHDGESLDPSFSPDGSRIAFADGRGAPTDSETGPEHPSIYTVNIDGSGLTRLTQGVDRSPTWSPSGDRIAFVRLDAGVGLWTVDVASGRESLVADLPGLADSEWLSESQIAVSLRDGVYAVDVRSGAKRRLTTDTEVVWNPTHTSYARAPVEHGGFIQVVDLPSGTVHDVPRSNTQVAAPLMWTATNELVFSQNVAGPGVNIVASENGTGQPEFLGPSIVGYEYPKSDNPVCSP